MVSGNSFISVIITTFNYGHFLRRSISSVLQQDLPNEMRELIVVNDGSTDESDSILREFGSAIRVITQSNSGQASAINTALENANGDIVAFLDPDDEWYPHKLSRVSAAFQNPEVGMVQHLMDIEQRGKLTRRKMGEALGSGDFSEVALTSRFKRMQTSALAFRREILNRLLPVPLVLRRGGADCYLAVVAAMMTRVCSLNEPLGLYRIHGANSFTDNHTAASLQEQIEAIEAIFLKAKEMAVQLGVSLKRESEGFPFAEYPMTCRITLAWKRKQFQKIPLLYFEYLRRYAFSEYGISGRLLERALRMAGCTFLPPAVFGMMRSVRRNLVFSHE